eukprot:3708323-Rhodomonas_salina.1
MLGCENTNVEPLQLVTYENCQYFDTHHDAGTLHLESRGVVAEKPRRIATVFVYLTTLPEGVGHT